MSNRCFGLPAMCMAMVLSASAQVTVEAQGIDQTTQVEIANNKRIFELLRHPVFITLRLISHRRDVASTTPSSYTVGDWMDFDFSISQSSSEIITLRNSGWPFYECRPELSRDGAVVPYSKEAQEKVQQAETSLPSGSSAVFSLLPNREYDWVALRLTDWYETLSPGHYQLTVRKRFVPNGDWAESNQVTFDVMSRRPAAPIPQGLKVRLVPQTTKPQVKGQPYRIGSDDYFDVEIVNDSDQPLKISVIDALYGNRLSLFKDETLVPYVPEAAKLIQSKESDPRLVELGDLVIPPKTTSQSQGLTLKNWYGALVPGLYRITNRRRFEIDGPWTGESAELVFEIVPQR